MMGSTPYVGHLRYGTEDSTLHGEHPPWGNIPHRQHPPMQGATLPPMDSLVLGSLEHR